MCKEFRGRGVASGDCEYGREGHERITVAGKSLSSPPTSPLLPRRPAPRPLAPRPQLPTPASSHTVMYNDSLLQLQFSLPRDCFLTGLVQR